MLRKSLMLCGRWPVSNCLRGLWNGSSYTFWGSVFGAPLLSVSGALAWFANVAANTDARDR